MTDTEEKATHLCEKCDRETTRVTKQLGADGSVHYVCWSCLYRTDKRINLKETWRRERRAQ
ncbi:MAG TPA: hypothetical protein VGV38_11220 [Pyrinomonadaceae bacterium]|nr:hypothetical protein [Pyrinomonadaceae bacterium]